MNVKNASIGIAVICFVTIFCSVMWWCGAHGFAPGEMENIPKRAVPATPHPPGVVPSPTIIQ